MKAGTVESFAGILAAWIFVLIMGTFILKRWFAADPEEMWFVWKVMSLFFAIRIMVWAWNSLP
jgi:membrane-associated protease RseP (regulator of RpoE activity)